MNNNVISIREKLETWQVAYDNGEFSIFVSNHGRFKFLMGSSGSHILEFCDSVEMLSSTSKLMEKAMSGLY